VDADMDGPGQFDIPSRLAPAIPAWLTQIACAIASVAIIVFLRRAIDAFLPGVAPFVLIYPAVLLATAFAGWRSGLLTLFLAEILIWRFLLTPDGVNMLRPADAGALILNTLSGLLVIGVAQAFRIASRAALQARSAQLATRELLFRELDHRVKNGFAIIASLLALQRKRETEPAAQAALAQVAQRIDGIARAHSDLYRVSADEKTVDLGAYLRDLCGNLGKRSFHPVRSRFTARRSVRRWSETALSLLASSSTNSSPTPPNMPSMAATMRASRYRSNAMAAVGG
jgi:hypothetical protein